jgi:hypothetical protein
MIPFTTTHINEANMLAENKYEALVKGLDSIGRFGYLLTISPHANIPVT